MSGNRPTLEDLARRSRMQNGIYKGTFWRHTSSGGVYEVSSIGIRENDYEEIVHYSPVSHPDLIFDRPLAEFREQMEINGVAATRFHQVKPVVSFVREGSILADVR